MRIMVTGGAGFVGSHVVDVLLKTYDVLIVDSLHPYYPPQWKRKRLNNLLNNRTVQWSNIDICNKEELGRIFQSYRPDIVIHLAAIPGVQPSLLDPASYVDVDVKGTVNLLSLAAQHQVSRFVFASSSSVYGIQGIRPCEENDLLQPISPYAAAKAAAEMYCQTYQRLYGLPVTIVRPFTVYGPEQRPDMALWRFATRILRGEPIVLYGEGIGRDYTFVSDTAEGIVRAALTEKAANRIYNIASGRVVQIRGLITLLGQALSIEPRVELRELPPGDVPMTWASITRAQTELGYQPRVSLEDGISQFTDWFLEEGVKR